MLTTARWSACAIASSSACGLIASISSPPLGRTHLAGSRIAAVLRVPRGPPRPREEVTEADQGYPWHGRSIARPSNARCAGATGLITIRLIG